METINIIQLWPYFIVALSGTLTHIIAKLAKLEKEKKFSLNKWLEENKYTSILSILLSLAGVIALDATQSLSYIAVFLMAYTGDSLIKNGKNVINKENNV